LLHLIFFIIDPTKTIPWGMEKCKEFWGSTPSKEKLKGIDPKIYIECKLMGKY